MPDTRQEPLHPAGGASLTFLQKVKDATSECDRRLTLLIEYDDEGQEQRQAEYFDGLTLASLAGSRQWTQSAVHHVAGETSCRCYRSSEPRTIFTPRRHHVEKHIFLSEDSPFKSIQIKI